VQTCALPIFVLDKTGTVTTGVMSVAEVIALQGTETPELLRLAGAVEYASEHPIAQAIAAHAAEEIGDLPGVEGFANTAGLGVSGTVDGHTVLAGRPKFLEAEGLSLSSEAAGVLAEAQDAGRTSITVGWDGEVRGIITLSDGLKETSTEAVTADRKSTRLNSSHVTISYAVFCLNKQR